MRIALLALSGAPEAVTRPDPGLARGVWETSPTALYVAGAAVVVLAALYLAFRLRLLRRRPKPAAALPRKP